MKIMITDSNGDSISITIGDNGSFRELNESLEIGNKMHTNSLANLQNEKRTDSEVRRTGADCSSKKSVEGDDNSNLQLLEEQVKSCLNQMKIEPDTRSAVRNSDIKVSISSENNDVTESKSLCRLCANQDNDMVYLFNEEEPYKNLIEKIEDCLPIMVTKTDTLPKKACRSCLEKLELCHKFHKTVSEAEKSFLILGGKISYDSEETTKYCQIISKDSRERSSSTGNEREDVNFDGTSATQVVLRDCYSSPNSQICQMNTDEESSLEELISNPNCENFAERSRKRPKKHDDISIEEPADEEIDAEQSDDPKIIRCRICKEGFQTVKKCFTHSRIHITAKNYPCNLCDEIFNNEKDWSEHNIEHKYDMRSDRRGDTNHVCDKCGKKFVSEPRLQFHAKYHNLDIKPYHCEICDKNLNSETMLYQHTRTAHEQNSKFSCEICGKEFGAQASVNAHQRKHRYVRSFECEICNKRLYSSDSLKMHKETHSVSQSEDENFSCVYCGKMFTEKLPLTVHIMSHTESESQNSESIEKKKKNKSEKYDRGKLDRIDRPFKCTVCDRTFDHSARLREHSSVHTGKRPYSCSVCGKSFKRANARKVHMVIHTGEKPYKCDLCGTNFRRAGDMRRHKKTQHGIIE